MMQGKRISILGDSISTYKGVSDDASANSTLSLNPFFYREPFPLEKTYWKLLIDNLGLTLCVNNSWSGGNLSGSDNSSAGVNRAAHLSRDDGKVPDLIVVFMGINDLGRGIRAEVFFSDYQKTLTVIKSNYPNAAVCCVNLPDRDIFLKKRAETYNKAIEKAVAAAGNAFFIADLFGSRLNNDFYYKNTLDGLHPDEDGMKIISKIIEDAIKTYFHK